jgi:hypothetical protein
MKLGGVVYLHDISQARMLGTTRKNFDMFRKLCGEDAAASIILGTTKWGEVQPDVGNRREDQLSSAYWKDMIAEGSRVQRFEDTHESAWAIVHSILKNLQISVALRIQNELVNFQQIIPETDAGKTLRYTLQQLLEMQKQMAEELEAQVTNEDDDAELQERVEEHRNQMRNTVKQITDLQIPKSRRVMGFFAHVSGSSCRSN